MSATFSLWRSLADRITHWPGRGAPQVARQMDQALTLARNLVSQHGETAGTKVAAELASLVSAMDEARLIDFFEALVRNFAADAEALQVAAQAYLADPSELQASRLGAACEPPRQELLRRINMAPGGTALLLAMRTKVLELRRARPDLEPLAYDLGHLLSSWFNRGFLKLEKIDWNAPAAILERLIAYEAVHAIAGWDDLRRRLTGDRRCFGFFHPALPGEPIIFVEVALTRTMSASVDALIRSESQPAASAPPNTAIFYSISSCQPGLRNISFGNLLIKQVVADLVAENPELKTFATLSPIPGFRAWVDKAVAAGRIESGLADQLAQPQWWLDAAASERLRPHLLRLCAQYLTGAPGEDRSVDPVARFHLSNGARLERINWRADLSPKGIAESHGLMVNYRYLPSDIEANHHAFVVEKRVVYAKAVREVMGPPSGPSGRQPARLSLVS
jgi:malonyl-CoA decarboxylase